MLEIHVSYNQKQFLLHVSGRNSIWACCVVRTVRTEHSQGDPVCLVFEHLLNLYYRAFLEINIRHQCNDYTVVAFVLNGTENGL